MSEGRMGKGGCSLDSTVLAQISEPKLTLIYMIEPELAFLSLMLRT